MKKVFLYLLLLVYSISIEAQPLSRTILKATQYLSSDTIRSNSGLKIDFNQNRIANIDTAKHRDDAIPLWMLRASVDTLRDSLRLHTHDFTEITGDPAGNNNLYNWVTNLINNAVPANTDTRLISGTVIWVDSLNYTASTLVYKILGKDYIAQGRDIRLNPADPDLPRIDVIYADIFGNINVLTGIPAPDPVKPLVGEQGLELTHVDIGAGAVFPGNVTNIQIYNENLGEPQEWTGSVSVEPYTSLSTNSTENPSHLTKNIRFAINAPDSIVPVETHYIGQEYAGGIIFYLQPGSNGKIGLIAAKQDVAAVGLYWSYISGYSTYLTSANGSAIGTGQANTNKMLAVAASSTQAAKYVNDYFVDSYYDWYLPSREELRLMYTYRNQIGGMINKTYWSSTETTGQFNWRRAECFAFNNGTLNVRDKNNSYYVRAIRSFNDVTVQPTVIPATKYAPQSTAFGFVNDSVVSSENGILSFYMMSNKPWLTESTLLIELYNGVTKLGSTTVSVQNSRGFIFADSAYHVVAINLFEFFSTQESFDRIVFKPINNFPNGLVLSIDNIRLQYGTVNPTEKPGYEYWVLDRCLPGYDIINGYLYNVAALRGSIEFAPVGWHVPSKAEFETLISNLGGAPAAGGALKETGFTSWLSPNTGATNSSGFTAPGSGARAGNGVFGDWDGEIGKFVAFWSTTTEGPTLSYSLVLDRGSASANIPTNNVISGFSIRLIKDDNIDPGIMQGNDKKQYETIKIADQVWMAENSAETQYRDCSPIEKVTDNALWVSNTSGAYSAYNNLETNAVVALKSTTRIYDKDTVKLCEILPDMPVYSANNGLTKIAGDTIQLGGDLLHTTTINAGVNKSLIVNGNNPSGYGTLIGTSYSYGANGLAGFAPAGFGVYGITYTGNGIVGASFGYGTAGRFEAYGGPPLFVYSDPANSSTFIGRNNNQSAIQGKLTLVSDCLSPVMNGFGGSIGFAARTSDPTSHTKGTNSIISSWVDVTLDAEQSELSFTGTGNGTVQSILKLGGDGHMALTPLSTPPASPELGWIYINTDTHMYFYNGTTWKQMDN